MPAKERITRTKDRAAAALEQLRAATSIEDQQHAWEAFLAAWRTTLNQISDYCRTNGQSTVATTLNAERLNDAILDYVWEARNAEEHTADGSSVPALTMVAHDVTLNGHQITFNGFPWVISEPEAILKFRDLAVRRNKTDVVLLGPSDAPISIADRSYAFLERAYQSVHFP